MREIFMSDIFAMQRANGDWFALDHQGRLCVPLFHSSQDAMIARLRNFGMLVFKPVLLDERFLKKIAPLPGEDEVDFCMVDDPFASLNRASTMGRRQLALLIRSADGHENIGTNVNTFQASDPGAHLRSDSQAAETWEDEGGTYASVREVARNQSQVGVRAG
jgi:hypothetical protein